MSINISPEARELEQQPPDYGLYCLVRDAALGIRNKTDVLPKQDSAYDVDFNAIYVSTNLPDPIYSPICRDIHVDWITYGRKERLGIEMSETSLDYNKDENRFFHQFVIRVKNKEVVSTWQNINYAQNRNTDHEAVSNPEHAKQAAEGLFIINEMFVVSNVMVRGDCAQMIKELERFTVDS